MTDWLWPSVGQWSESVLGPLEGWVISLLFCGRSAPFVILCTGWRHWHNVLGFASKFLFLSVGAACGCLREDSTPKIEVTVGYSDQNDLWKNRGLVIRVDLYGGISVHMAH